MSNTMNDNDSGNGAVQKAGAVQKGVNRGWSRDSPGVTIKEGSFCSLLIFPAGMREEDGYGR